ncbi:LysR family transcriptional regulator [Pseudobacteriovorax antillogorgiicola]|uniref:DNA-binding transcriptional regulator, LysR family n=1 Tax=Pseudobacteriovorax antillogorgiicola TaxID=1513793 RepID=A0A1Y6BGS0_9BACT|nr:LysR family transcriptional regulator [Pseudobacteriovorax antillogorgiicola]TCS55589.1 DNA-binding transcriptional LysR family regulator [Pseudobacteriovorax antillogorgiicola]SMF10564.1 DNA-binding transcriptional regulator, LysR family [Pseudobacteriovorax antillogorgiicola]
MKTLKDINWNQVYCFYEVARKLSMKEASQILGVSKPTVSEQIKKLEELLDVTLFVRYPRKIKLTNEGTSLFACAKEMFEVGGRFLDTVSPDAIGGYCVRVGILESQTASVGLDFVSQYWDIFAPFGTVTTIREVMQESLMEKLIRGHFDWGVAFRDPVSPRLECREIAKTRLVFCCSPRIYAKFKHKEDILRSIPVAKSSWDSRLNEVIDDAFRKASIFPDEVIESDHPQFIINLAQRGRCVAIFPSETIDTASWGKELKVFELEQPVEMTLYALWPKGNERRVSIRKLIELLDMNKRPEQMQDPDLQIKVGDVKDSMLE